MGTKNLICCDGPDCDRWEPQTSDVSHRAFTHLLVKVSRIKGLDPGVRGELDFCSLECLDRFVHALRGEIIS